MAHRSVLLQSSIEGLDIKEGDVLLDGTVGDGGHSQAICQSVPHVKIIGVDLDYDSLAKAEKKLKESKCDFVLKKSNFKDLDKVLEEIGVEKVDKIILDLGLNSDQLDISGRGFTFQKDEPLFMTYEKEGGNGILTAKEIVNEWGEKVIAEMLEVYGEENFGKRIARKIVEERIKKPIETTFDLVEIIKSATPKFYHFRKIHPATKTFQALRVAVNGELSALTEGLEKGFERLKSGGRMAVISFNSLEDRIVKRFFKGKVSESAADLITKKPITPSVDEISENPRSRSAKLRIILKI